MPVAPASLLTYSYSLWLILHLQHSPPTNTARCWFCSQAFLTYYSLLLVLQPIIAHQTQQLTHAVPAVLCSNIVLTLQVLLSKGVDEGKILFLSLIAAPEGIHRICAAFPRVKVITSEIDEGIGADFQVIPGIQAVQFIHQCLSLATLRNICV